MSNFPNSLDDDTSLTPVFNNITEIGEQAINEIRSAIFAMQENTGLNANGSLDTIAARLNVSIEQDGTIKPSAITALGLVTLPIYNDQIADTAAIHETKLNLYYTTTALKDLIDQLNNSVDVLNGFVSITGVKVEPHIDGTDYNHNLSNINVDFAPTILNQYSALRNNVNSLLLFKDLNDDFVIHQKSDGASGTIAPVGYGHVSAGIYLDTSNFTFIPQTSSNLQTFANFVDSSSLALLGSRIQTLYSNGIPRSARGNDLVADGYGQLVVDATPVTTYLLNNGSSSPVDDIATGDDIVLFKPSSALLSNNIFESQFSQVRPGDIIKINYGTVIVSFVIDSVKNIFNGSSSTYAVRLSSKNLFASTTAVASIYRPLYTEEKYGVLAVSAANPESSNYLGSLIVSNPNSASALSIGFDPSQFDQSHYNLYLTLYPSGNPADKVISMPAIDVTGNKGVTPGKYTLESIVSATNDAIRKNGFNFRFTAYSYRGEFGIMLADSYQNAAFSIISGATDSTGSYTSTSNAIFPNNVIDGYNQIDPLGFGPYKANLASPPYSVNYASVEAAQNPTRIHIPLRKKFYYANGLEKDKLNQTIPVFDNLTLRDEFGDGYWLATIVNKSVQSNRLAVTYKVNLDLSAAKLKKGKTLVVLPNIAISDSAYNTIDHGRFIIDDITFNNCNTSAAFTNITVYDAVHGVGFSPFATSDIDTKVRLYFSDDSVDFDIGNVGDEVGLTPYKRFFEILVNGTTDQSSETLVHERARFLDNNSDIFNINFYNVSPKLRGYTISGKKRIVFRINNFDQTTGIFDGYLSNFNGSTYSNIGPISIGKKGIPCRFYDESNIDFIELVFNTDDTVASFSNTNLTIDLFPTLTLDEELMLIATCQVNDVTKKITYLRDNRQFGNTSEKQLSTSALDYIATPQRILNENAVISGFEFTGNPISGNNSIISFKGGRALVNGKFLDINPSSVRIPILKEVLYPAFTAELLTIKWYLCLNDKSEYEFIASTDYDVSLNATYGSLDYDRIFYVKNPSNPSGAAYQIRSSYLNKIVKSEKDLLPLYLVTATVSLFNSQYIVNSYTVKDLKRFAENGHHGMINALSFGPSASFRSFDSLSNYINELTGNKYYTTTKNNNVGSTVHVKGTVDISGEIFDFPVKTKFISDDAQFTVTTSSATIVQNSIFDGLNISVDTANGFLLNGSNIEFNNCNIDYSYNATGDGLYVDGYLSNPRKGCLFSSVSSPVKNIRIDKCNFTSSIASRFPFISILGESSTSYYENLSISENTFTTSDSSEDKRSVISIVGRMPNNTTISPTIVNGNINKNICNKSQMIIISGEIDTVTNNIRCLPVTINTSIDGNTCGSICYFTRQTNPSEAINTTGIGNKNSHLYITNNTCRLIYTGAANGFVNYPASSSVIIYFILSGAGIFSGSVTVDNNICSWVQLGIRSPSDISELQPVLNINNNDISAFNPAFLNEYYSGISPYNIGMLINSSTGT